MIISNVVHEDHVYLAHSLNTMLPRKLSGGGSSILIQIDRALA